MGLQGGAIRLTGMAARRKKEEIRENLKRTRIAQAAEREWEYPPIGLKDGTDLTGEQVRQVVLWYWQSGQAREDMEGAG